MQIKEEDKVGAVLPHEPIITVGYPVLYESIKAVGSRNTLSYLQSDSAEQVQYHFSI